MEFESSGCGPLDKNWQMEDECSRKITTRSGKRFRYSAFFESHVEYSIDMLTKTEKKKE